MTVKGREKYFVNIFFERFFSLPTTDENSSPDSCLPQLSQCQVLTAAWNT